jgi:hypothetical protein
MLAGSPDTIDKARKRPKLKANESKAFSAMDGACTCHCLLTVRHFADDEVLSRPSQPLRVSGLGTALEMQV